MRMTIIPSRGTFCPVPIIGCDFATIRPICQEYTVSNNRNRVVFYQAANGRMAIVRFWVGKEPLQDLISILLICALLSKRNIHRQRLLLAAIESTNHTPCKTN
jgi:hypothetical protein